MEGETSQSRRVGNVTAESLLDGVLMGASAYVLGYVVTFLLTVLDGFEVAGDVPNWTAVGWVFYGAHTVPIEVSSRTPDELTRERVSVFEMDGVVAGPISELANTIPRVVYLLVPVIVLLAVGYVAYRAADERHLERRPAATLGASVVIGYLALAVTGVVVFEHSRSLTVRGQTALSVSAGPDLVTGVVLAGLVYPIALVAIGGQLARRRGGIDRARI